MPKIKNRYRKIFHTHRVVDIHLLREQLGNRSPRSIFRDLAREGYSTSYTHSGKYYTLKHIPRFDLDGLWFYQDIGFSKQGTLKNTLIQLVDCAEIGKTHDELKKQLRIRVHNTLLDLVHCTKISRSHIDNIYVYVSTDEHRAHQQIQRRRSLATVARKTIELPPELIRLLRQQIESIKAKISPNLLFPDRPRISFTHSQTDCTCGNKLNVLKTRDKKVTTLDIGEFLAHETVLHCPLCNKQYFSEELNRRVPHQCRFGFDVVVFVGEALFIHHRSDVEICQLLREKNVAISLREIAYLGKKFIVYLALCHQSCADEIKRCMKSNGGYILHLDGTCEGDSPHLMSCMDQISHIVLDNIKIPSENARQLTPFLKGVQASYGDPIAVVHDMSSAIIHCVESVFPSAKDFVCHFHFLRDIGKDLFGFEYNNIRRYLSTLRTRSVLRKATRELKRYIAQDDELNSRLINYLKRDTLENAVNKLPAPVLVYLLVTWVLEAKTQSHGYGFPFDRPHLDFYHRLQEAYPKMRELKSKLPPDTPKLPLTAISRALNDQALNKSISLMQEKVILFDELREAMRIALPSGHQGLKDEGDQEIKTIKARVSAFRYSDNIKQLASSHIAYRKMVKQIDKYWDKLFADPIQVETKDGTVSIQPQRTNNIMETLFRDIKRDGRRKTGTSSLSKALKSMLANTPLVKNLSIPAYMEIILAGKANLAERFADIDTRSVREALKHEDEDSRKYPKGMAKVFKIPHFPEKLSIFTSKTAVAT